MLRSAKRLLLPHGYCDFVYSNTVLRGSPDKPDGETILNVLRCFRVAAPSIRFVPWAALASCWPLPQQLLPASAAGGGRRRCCTSIAEELFIISRLSRSAERSKRYFHGRGSNGKRQVQTLPSSPSQALTRQLPQRGSHWRVGGGPADRAKLVQCGNNRAPLSRSTAAANEDRARRFAPYWAQANSTACPACQWLSLWEQRRRPPPAAETGRSCWGSGQQDASAAQGTMRMLGAATRSWQSRTALTERVRPLPA